MTARRIVAVLAMLVVSAFAASSHAAEVPPDWGSTLFAFDCPGCSTGSSEGAAVEEVRSNHDFGCGAAVTPDTGWYWGGLQGLSLTDPTLHIAQKGFNISYETDPPACSNTVDDYHTLTMQRLSAGCPSGYNGPFTIPQPDGPYLVCTTESGAQDYFENPYTAVCSPTEGNPCELSTGAKIERVVDYSGPGLEFYRTYRSNMLSVMHSLTPQEFPLHAWPYGVLGGNWVHRYGSRIVYDIIPVVPRAWIDPDGALVGWLQVQPNVFVAENGSGIQLRPADPADWGGDWIIYYPSGAKEIHRWHLTGATGIRALYLTEVHDSLGRVTTVNYTLDAYGREIGGWIWTIVGPFGHALNFEITAPVQPPTSVQPRWDYFLDPAGDRIDFVHTPQDPSMAGRRLQGVIYQDQARVDYLYEDFNPVVIEPRDFLLRGIVDENGVEYATFEYWDVATQGADLRTRSTRHGAYEYTGFQYAYGGESTTVTDSLGNAKTYEFQPTTGSGPEARNPDRIIRPDTSYTVQANEPGGQRRLTRTVDENGIVTAYEYDEYHLTRRMEDFDEGDPIDPTDDTWARETAYEYLNDTSDLKTRVRTPSAACPGKFSETVTAYHPGTQWVASVTDSGYGPGDCGSPSPTVTRTVTFSDFNAFGQPRRIDGPRSVEQLSIEYYECSSGAECGQVMSVTNALGHVTSYPQYDAHGRVTRSVDPNGAITDYSYTPRGFVDRISTSGGNATREIDYGYDSAGQITRVSHGGGPVLDFTWNDAHLLESVADGDGNRIVYSYDSRGNVVSEHREDPAGAIRYALDRSYDSRNRLEWINSGGNSTTYLGLDGAGNVVGMTDPNGNSSSLFYDPLNRPDVFLDALNGVGNPVTYGYDSHDNVTSVRAANGAETTFAYDDLGNLVAEVSPDRGTMLYAHDAAGNMTCRADGRYSAGATTCEDAAGRWTYTYDALNRVDTVDYGSTAASPDVDYGYDGQGESGRLDLVSRESETGEIVDTQYDYDALGNLVEQRQFVPGSPAAPAPFVTGYEYDGSGLTTRITYPSGRSVEYVRSDSGRIRQITHTPPGETSATTLVHNVFYEPFGPPGSIAFGNGLFSVRSYDQAYRVVQHGLVDAAPALVDYHMYTLDGAGNVLQDLDLLDGSNSRSHAYDRLNRLIDDTKIDLDPLIDTYGYDGNGNRLRRTATEPGYGDQQFAYDVTGGQPNRISTLNSRAVSYDGAGNLKSDGSGRSFAYESSGRLRRIRKAGTTLTMLYNGNGELARTRTVPFCQCGGCASWNDFYHFSTDGRALGMVQVTSSGTRIERDWIWLDEIPVAQIQEAYSASGVHVGTQIVYLHADHLGTPRTGTDENGVPVWRNQSDAFGAGPVGTPGTVMPLRFPGQIDLYLGGIYYNYYRDYDSTTGRYLESDPIGLAGELNTYGYVAQNPLGSIDPSGLIEWTGAINGGSGGVILNGGFFTIDLESKQCIDGDRMRVRILAGGLGVGLGYFSLNVNSTISLDDGLQSFRPNQFAGRFDLLSYGVGLGPRKPGSPHENRSGSIGGYAINIGGSTSRYGDRTGVTGGEPLITGEDAGFGISLLTGRSILGGTPELIPCSCAE